LDLLTISVIFLIGKKANSHKVAVGAALLYSLCPGGVFLTGRWIQTDPWFILPAVLGVWWLYRGRVVPAWAALAVAASAKLLAILVLPIFVIGTWRWYGVRSTLTGLSTLVLTFSIVAAPLLFSGQAEALIQKTTQVSSLQWITLSSHNLWYALSPQARHVGQAANRFQNEVTAGVSFNDAGLILMTIAFALILTRLAVRSGPKSAFAASATAWLAFFTLATRVHVRYILPSLSLIICAGLFQRRWWILFVVLSVTLLLNLVLKSADDSPLARLITLNPDQAVANAWVNVVSFVTATAIFVTPVLKSAQLQARLEGALGGPLRLTEFLLIGTAWVVLVGIALLVIQRNRSVGTQIACIRQPLVSSLDEAIGTDDVPLDIIVINWPGAILAGDSANLWGVIPVTPPGLFLTTPEIVERGATWVQYTPWQEDIGLDIEYYGSHVTLPELSELAYGASSITAFNAQSQQMLALAERWSAAAPRACAAEFDDRICLARAQANQMDNALQIQLEWWISGTVSVDETIFAHIVDDEGAILAQADGDPANGLLPLSTWDRSTGILRERRVAVMPTGDYRVLVGLYNRASGERLEAQCRQAGACQHDALEIPAP
jgi:hypothetical protein